MQAVDRTCAATALASVEDWTYTLLPLRVYVPPLDEERTRVAVKRSELETATGDHEQQRLCNSGRLNAGC